MTRATNARVAGITYLAYIAVGLPAALLFGQATNAQGTAAKLARIAQHVPSLKIAIALNLTACFAALVLAASLYGITRDEDPEVALLALSCRVGEGVLGAMGPVATLALMSLATADADAAALPIGALLFKMKAWSETLGATFFSVGSTLFCCLLLRGRIIPGALGWLGVAASVVLLVGLPLELIGLLRGLLASLIWLPMLVFEVTLALWLLVKGLAERRRT